MNNTHSVFVITSVLLLSSFMIPINDAFAETTFVSPPFDVSGHETVPTGLAFNIDGTKMFVVGNQKDYVNEYACSTGFDVSTCAHSGDGERKDVSDGDETVPQGLAFNIDGTKMFVIGSFGSAEEDYVNEYECTAFDVSTCEYSGDGERKDVSDGDETNPSGLAFNTDGTKMFVIGSAEDYVNEYECTAFDVSTCSYSGDSARFSVVGQESDPTGLAFNTDGTKMFVVGVLGDANEYACSTGFDVSTCSFTDAFVISGQELIPHDLAFNTDGTKMFLSGSVGREINEYTLEVGFDFDGVPAESSDEESTTKKKSSSDCYDCKPPVLQSSHIRILTNDYVVATGDDPLHITAHVGDKVTILLNVTDNKSVDTFRFAGLYTNYQEKPSDMNTFYANNYDKWKHVSTSFYEWNVRTDDVAYDYDGTVSWSDNSPTVVTDVIPDENYFMKNDDNTLEYFMMPFTFTMNDSMEQSAITAKIYDASGNRLYETLPVTLEIIPKETVVLSDDEAVAILDKGDVIVTPSEDTTPLLNESVLFTVLSQWSGYSQVISDDAEMLSVIGLQGESLPAWTKNLGEWVIQEKLDVSELITAINYVHNNQ